MRVAQKPIVDGKLDQAAFVDSCKAGLFMAKTETGAPLAGANSSTESQAKDRAVAAGSTNVSGSRRTRKGSGVVRNRTVTNPSVLPSITKAMSSPIDAAPRQWAREESQRANNQQRSDPAEIRQILSERLMVAPSDRTP
jgi:hypothetical protein